MSNWHDRRERDREHEYELRRHEPRPGDRGFSAPGNEVPARLDRPLTTAMDIVVLVKAMPNYADAAALIERFVDAERARIRLEAVAAGANP